jgi:hypothetical protein
MSYADALADLKACFGPKKLLTMVDIAPHIGKSRGAQTKLQGRGRFPMPVKKVGNTICVSIYDLAHLIGDEAEEPPTPRPVKTTGAAAKTPKAQKATTVKAPTGSKPTRRPPSLGKLLRGYGKRLEELAVEVEAERLLFTELEAIEMGRAAKRGRSEKRETP